MNYNQFEPQFTSAPQQTNEVATVTPVQNTKKSNCYALLFWMPIVFVTVHVAYGWGYLVGLMKIILKRPFNVESNR